MVPTRRLRVLRPATSRAALYDEKLMDEIIRIQIDDGGGDSQKPRQRGRPRRTSSSGAGGAGGSLAREIDVEALIAVAVGFPGDSLTEEEIESNVVQIIGGADQANYIVIRNHIVSRWRSNVSIWMTPDHAMESIRSEHRALVMAAYNFLLEHGYINFGLAPAIKEAGWRPPGPHQSRRDHRRGWARWTGRCPSLAFSGLQGGGQRGGGGGGPRWECSNGNQRESSWVLARQLGFPLHKVRDKCPLYLPDGRAVDPDIDSKVEVAFNQLLEKVCKLRQVILEYVKSVDVPLGTALEAFRQVYGVADTLEERMLLNWHLANLEYANAALLSDLSMAFWDQDDPYEMGGDHCFIPGGNVRFVRALIENLPIFYGKTVSRIQYGSDGVLVYTNGQIFQGDMALCTVPLGVLKKGSIEFAIKRLGFGLLNKVAMLFPRDFWGGGIDTFGHLTEDESQRGEFFLFYSYSSVSGGPLLVALVAGESALKFEQMPPVEPVERVLETLRRIFSPKGIEVPDPVQVVCTRWGADKFAYGSYSYVAVGASGDDYDFLAESVGDGRVFFAGEATNRRYPATMHGALLSGLREAASISRLAKRRSAAPPTRKADIREQSFDLDKLFENPDASFGGFSVLYDPCSGHLDSLSLLRLGIGERNLESYSHFLYGVISRKEVVELAALDRDADRLGLLSRRSGTKLVGRKGLGISGEALISRIKAARSTTALTSDMLTQHNY
ncbi:unnamed protein product [Spirodela intermedia]|uniref:SWIRM domain-containing protein n=1 Tax=Spirodela intermedia TaxID=51605 RepID=A0A7I8ILK2_SPIIN|nr:unnamed protein product [Spirodela intermedia]CAA6658834.1 unnamed protein product [Spirodela intermedia]